MVSLMLAKVVDQSGCAESHGSTSTDVNETLHNDSYFLPTDQPSIVVDSPEVMKCKIGVAMAASFMVGIFQVNLRQSVLKHSMT